MAEQIFALADSNNWDDLYELVSNLNPPKVTNLKKVCDEIFGSSNFKSTSIIINNRGGRDYGGIALQHDYVLIYTKSITSSRKIKLCYNYNITGKPCQ